MRFLFLNQYGAGDPSPTARLLDGLADYLRARGHQVEIAAQGQAYHGRPAAGAGRMRRELKALLTITWHGLRAAKPDAVLALSSPPGLLVAAAVVARRHGAPLVHWAMDLYPELAVALGEIKPGSGLRRAVQWAMAWAYHRARLIVALDADMQSHLETSYSVAGVRVLAPWPSRQSERLLAAVLSGAASPPEGGGARKPWTWLYSGNLGRAHEWRTLLEAQQILEGRGLPVHLVFQGDGAARGAAETCAGELGLRNCHWTGYVAAEDLVVTLLAAQVLIATQRPETRGLLWPSKLALLERLPVPLLWIGPTEGEVAQRLLARGQGGVFAPGQAEAVADWMEGIYRQPPAAISLPSAAPTLEDGGAQWEKWLNQVVDL